MKKTTPKKHVGNTRIESGAQESPGWMTDKWLAIIVVMAAIALYANTLKNGFVLDDLAVISHNTFVQKGVAGIPEILSTPSLRGFADRVITDTAASNDIYRPVSLTLFAIAHQLFPGSAQAGHLMNMLLFAACALLLYRFLRKLFAGKGAVFAFIAAMLFVVHPVHTEVVANIKSSDELLCFVFAFGGLLLYMRYVDGGKTTALIQACLCYFLSLLSKETSISFVVLVPVLFYFFYPAGNKRALTVGIATAAAAIVYLGLRYAVLNAFNANHPDMIGFMENPLTGAPDSASRIATALLVMLHYIRLLLVPYPLSSDDTFASIPFTGFDNPLVWLSVLVYISLAITVVFRLITKRFDAFTFGIFFFLLTIVLFTNLVFLTGSIMAERFLFFPSVGLCVVVAAAVTGITSVQLRKVSFGIAIAAGILFAGITMARNNDWESNYSLIAADAAKCPENARLQHGMGYVLATTEFEAATNNTEKYRLLQDALKYYQKSLAIYAGQSKVHTDMANAYVQLQQFDSAEYHMKAAIALQPREIVIISMLGGVYFSQGKYQQTLALCRDCLDISPGNVAVLNNMGMCYLQLGMPDSVVYVSQQVLQQDPANELAQRNMAAAKKN